MTLVAFALGFLLTLRLTRLVTTDKITEPLRDKLRAYLSPFDYGVYDQNTATMTKVPKTLRSRSASALSSLVDCDWCTSVWVAAAVAPLAYYQGSEPAFIIASSIAAFSWLTGFATTVNDAQSARANY